jgi:hypothetical protein
MLKAIHSDKFKKGPIHFHAGLNVVVGDPEAKNSIGKSTALMLIDFAFGGSGFYDYDGGAIEALGHHIYYFDFEFNNEKFTFSRSTENKTEVIRHYSEEKTERMSIDDFNEFLKSQYLLNNSIGTWRSIITTYSRIWGKTNQNIAKPLESHTKQTESDAINILIDVFEKSSEIQLANNNFRIKTKYKTVLNQSLEMNFIPKINKTQYNQNKKTIQDRQGVIEAIKSSFATAITAYNQLMNESMIELGNKKHALLRDRSDLTERIARIKRDLSLSSHSVSKNMRLLVDFFPNANKEKIETIEVFHNKIGKILAVELQNDLNAAQASLDLIDREISQIDLSIETGLRLHNTPNDIFEKAFQAKKELEEAANGNLYFEKREAAKTAWRTAKQEVANLRTIILEEVAQKINTELRFITDHTLSKERQSPIFWVNGNSYGLHGVQDTGTGKSFLNLLSFDLAILKLTKVPFIIHDSFLFKNIENTAVSKLIELYSTFEKQIFISLDEVQKYTSNSINTVKSCAVINLDANNMLYVKDWRNSSKL